MKKRLEIKICGNVFPNNAIQVSALLPEAMGFIFYKNSPRNIRDLAVFSSISEEIERVGVFVDEPLASVLVKAEAFSLRIIQVHGKETVDYCKKLKKAGLKVWKVFGVEGSFDFEETKKYEAVVDAFLFDTKTSKHGGSGRKFDWSKLNEYQGIIPFWLSGGIRKEDAQSIKDIEHSQLKGVDLNSGFEREPGLKNTEDLNEFIAILRDKSDEIPSR